MPENNSIKKRIKTKEISERTAPNPATDDSEQPKSTAEKKRKPLKFDALPKLRTYRLWTRGVVTVAVFCIVYFIAGRSKEKTFARQKETIPLRTQLFPCSDTYLRDIRQYPDCEPRQCGRFVIDTSVDKNEVDTLLDMVKTGMSLGGSSGGASILDLHSGALSKGEAFVNVYKIIAKGRQLFTAESLELYRNVRQRIQEAIAERFGIQPDNLYLTHPTFFSRITNAPAKTVHDEYWHPHVDKETYGSFHYTSLLYLSDYKKEFTGGRFLFVNGADNRTETAIEPKRGRVSVFTSGAENFHRVEEVTAGIRYAITISFTCNPKLGIADPTIIPN